MKVRVQNNIEISDEQRVLLARKLDGPDAKKRQATREEIQDFVWSHGAQWADWLIPNVEDLVGVFEDLLGVSSESDEDLLGVTSPTEPELDDEDLL